MAPVDTLWELETHSLGKHHILRRYAQAWMPIMSSAHKRLVVVDGFAGPGRYLGGEPGSPLILLEAYLSHKYRATITSEVIYLFIEERRDRVDHLRTEIDKLDLPSSVRVHVEQGRYEEIFGVTLRGLQRSGQRLAPTLAFIDPFGYSDAPMDLTGQFFEFKHCEVLVYMPLAFVSRFVGRPGQEGPMTSLFGTSQGWRPAIQMQGDARRQFLHDLFRDQLHANGCSFVRSFEIQTDRSNGYYLFFGTNHELGLEKMKEAMWSLDPLSGQSFRDSTNGDQLVLFKTRPDTRSLEADLHAKFGDREFTIDEAERFTNLETAFKKTHLREPILVPAERDGRLEVLTDRHRKRSYPGGTRMRFVQNARGGG